MCVYMAARISMEKNFLCALEFVLQLPSIEHGLVFFLVPCGNQNHYTDEVIYATNGLLLSRVKLYQYRHIQQARPICSDIGSVDMT